LQEASKLCDVIINGTIEDVVLAQVVQKELELIGKGKISTLSNEEIASQIHEKLEAQAFVVCPLSPHFPSLLFSRRLTLILITQQPQLSSFVFSHTNTGDLAKAGKMNSETRNLFGFGSTSSTASTQAFGGGGSAFGSFSFGSASPSSIATTLQRINK